MPSRRSHRHYNRRRKHPRRVTGRETVHADGVRRLCVTALAVLLCLAFFVPLFAGIKGDKAYTSPQPSGRLWPSVSSPLQAGQLAKEDTETIQFYNINTEAIETMTVEDYLVGTVSAEMPASYQLEALKAQAVAARTLLCFKLQNGGCTKHEGADICGDFGHCQAYNDDAKLREVFGSGYDTYLNKIKTAVKETQGQILTYNGEVIEAFYHSMSGGKTEDSEHVFNGSFEYLRSVESPGEESNEKYNTTKSFSKEEFTNLLKAKYPAADTTLNLQDGISILSRYDSGRVERCSILGVELSGVEVRTLYSLPSANFTITVENDTVTFSNIGSGHGVGMSQVGANVMAQNGSGYSEILTHYYTGVNLTTIESYH